MKAVARDLLDKLKRELLVLDWRNRQVTRAAVQVGIEEALDAGLPDIYDRALFSRKAQDLFQHVFTSYEGSGKSVYEAVA